MGDKIAAGAHRSINWAWLVATLVGLCATAAAAQNIEYVIQISVDGLHASQLQSLMQTQPDRYANFWRFVNEGATTFNARTDYSNTFTLPNHTTMITGRPVSQPADDATLHHGYLNNSSPKPTDTLHNAGNPALDYVASTFDQAHDHGRSTALYTGKDKFVIYEQSYNVTETTNGGRPDTYLADGDQGVNKIDKYDFEVIKGTSTGIMETLVEDYQTAPFNYALLHFLEPDAAGHAFGWRSPEWNDIVNLVDQHLGQLFALVENQPQLMDRTAIILTADHGGSLLGHDAIDDPNIFRVPFFVWGPGVAAGSDLYELNPLTRLDPGQGRPDYTQPQQPIRNGDSANLAMSLLALPPVEGSSINPQQDLRVDLPQDVVWNGADDQYGIPGDGWSWSDARNWTRGTLEDRSPIAGDEVWLPQNVEPQQLSLGGQQRIDTLHVEGDYQLVDGNLQMLTGDLMVAEGRRLTIKGRLSSPHGVIMQGPGTLVVDAVESSDLLVTDGTIQGPLVVTGNVANRGEMNPGSGESVQHIQGNYTQSSTGILRLTLSPNDTNDQLMVDDVAIYRGLLAVETDGLDLDPDTPGQVSRWTLVTHNRRVGSFFWVDYDGQRLDFDRSATNAEWLHVGDGLFRRLEYTDEAVRWVNYRAIAGDANGDGAFNTVDLVDVFTTGGYENGVPNDAQWTTGDWNGDHDFNSSDLVAAFVAGRFEQPSLLAAVEVQNVPEPDAAWLVVLAVVGATGWMRRPMTGS